MKKIIYIAVALLLCASLLVSCTGTKVNITDGSKETSADVEDVPGGEKKEGDNGEGYAKPATFARLYAAISDLRNDFYDTLTASLAEVSDDTQLFIDIYKAMAGESTFVYISTCGTGDEKILKKALSVGEYIDIEISAPEDGVWRIDLKAKTDKGYRKGGFNVIYDKEADGFKLDYSVEDGTFRKFYAKRAQKGYIAQYLDNTGLYVRYILGDDGTGKMLVCDSTMWQNGLPDTEEKFDTTDFIQLFELTGDKFHSISNGVEDTYPEVKPE